MSVKDMKQDEVGMALESFGARATEFAKANRNTLIAASVAIVVIAFGVNGWRWWRQSVEARAQTALSAAVAMGRDLENPPASVPGKEPAKPATWQEVATAFATVATEHPGTAAGELAAYQAGVAHLRAGDAATAATALRSFSESNPTSWAAPHALAALATASEQQGDLVAAEAALVKLKDGEFTSHAPGAAMARLAEFYDRQGRAEDAKKLWTSLAEDARFADTASQGQAKAKLAQSQGG